jgi:hypothetical protein
MIKILGAILIAPLIVWDYFADRREMRRLEREFDGDEAALEAALEDEER